MKFLFLLFMFFVNSFAEIDYETSMGIGYYSYKEPDIMEISGPVLEYKLKGANYIDGYVAEMFMSVASTVFANYDGSFTSGVPLKANSVDIFGSAGIKFGLDLAELSKNKNIKGSFYTGFGTRVLYNKVSADGAYDRFQTYLYIPIGFSMIHNPKSKISIRYGAEGRWLAQGYNTSYLSQVRSTYSDLSFTQKDGFGAALYLGIEYNLFAKRIFTQVSADYWQVGNSDEQCTAGDCFIEPKNRTIMGSLEFGIKF